ncbi:hypothetical protein, partial [Psychrobacter sp. S1-30-MNA-CIBAN-0213]|uniref:hypothetical protein n=1 Tax=Psychrobacter sp. S1-30-MNA-CIBAN-0213 TaxID=3140456 RepID=UPI00331D95AE
LPLFILMFCTLNLSVTISPPLCLWVFLYLLLGVIAVSILLMLSSKPIEYDTIRYWASLAATSAMIRKHTIFYSSLFYR